MQMILGAIIGLVVGIPTTIIGFGKIKEKIMKKKIKKIIRQVIIGLQEVEKDIDKDDLETILNKLANLANKIGYGLKH